MLHATRLFCCTVFLTAAPYILAAEKGQFVSQTVPTQLESGKPYNVSIVYKNVGDTPWTHATQLKLKALSTESQAVWGINEVPLGANDHIPPGESQVFSFQIEAPKESGPFPFQWVLAVAEKPVADATPALSITVKETEVRQARFVSQILPEQLESGGSYRATFQFQNTGKEPWTAQSNMILKGIEGSGETWGSDDIPLQLSEPVPPQAIATFTIPFTAPNKAGTYPFQWQLVQGKDREIGDTTPSTQLQVGSSSSARPAEFVFQQIPEKMQAAASYTVSITFKNTSGQPWHSGEVYLAPQSPANNLNWMVDRVDLEPGETVQPGNLKTFTFTVKAPTTPAIYAFQWQLNDDKLGWFGEKSDLSNMQVYQK